MRVLYIIHSTIMGGATISFANMLNGLKGKGIEPVVVYPSNSKELDVINHFQKQGIDCYPVLIVPSTFPPLSNPKDIILFAFKLFRLFLQKRQSFVQLQKLVRSLSPDIIHTNSGIVHEGYRVAQKCWIPHCWHLREYQDKDFGWLIYPSKKSFIKMLKKSVVIPITKSLRNYFELENYKNEEVIYNGVLPLNHTDYIHEKDKYFLCASRISKEKGYEEIIGAFARFCGTNADYQLYIAGFGDPDYIENLKCLTDKLKCSGRIQFLGFVPGICELMKKASVLIVASKHEGFGRMTAEALFCGCKVIGKNTGGTKEIIEYTGGGMLYTNRQELTNCLFEIAGEINTEKYKSEIIRAQKKAALAYSNEQNAEKIYRLYQSIQ